MFSTAVSCIGYIILATCSQESVGVSYFALFFVIGGNFSLFPLVMCVCDASSALLFDHTLFCVLGVGQRTRCRLRVREASALPSSSLSQTACQCKASMVMLCDITFSHFFSSAAPQIYFDPNDKFRRAHGIAAGYKHISMLISKLTLVC